jgi:S-adenosylmethionine:tRNA ribosyltransferase-isomerase
VIRLDEFGYHLPEALIAQSPPARRDKARLMVVDRKTGSVTHDIFANITRYLLAQSCLVVNDSKVIPARLLGRREQTGGRVEILLLKKLEDGYSYQALIRPLRRLDNHDRIIFNGGRLTAEVQDRENRVVRFNRRDITPFLEKFGHMPLPPYIKRPDRASDRKYYQTVYAKSAGSVASPTAGLHFTARLLKSLARAEHTVEKVTLHINYATFKPVEEPDVTKHKMHFEDYKVTQKTWGAVTRAKAGGRKIVAVGTTSCRVLETVAAGGPLNGRTDIFMYPGYEFKMVDSLITNFHLPFSTLLMLVYAFGSQRLMSRAYREAVELKYRFYSYGDAMMIL